MFDFKEVGAGLSGHLTAIVIQMLVGLGSIAVLFPMLAGYMIDITGTDNHIVPLYIFGFVYFSLPMILLEVWFRLFRNRNKGSIDPGLNKKINRYRLTSIILAAILAVAMLFLNTGNGHYLELGLVIFHALGGLIIFIGLRKFFRVRPRARKIRRRLIMVIVITSLLNAMFHFVTISNEIYPSYSGTELNTLINHEKDLQEEIEKLGGSSLEELEALVFIQKLTGAKPKVDSAYGHPSFRMAMSKMSELSALYTSIYKENTAEGSISDLPRLNASLVKLKEVVFEVDELLSKGTETYDKNVNYQQFHTHFYSPWRNLVLRLNLKADQQVREQIACEINAMRGVGLTLFILIITVVCCMLVVLRDREQDFREIPVEERTPMQKTTNSLRLNLRVILAALVILGFPLIKKAPPSIISLEKPGNWVRLTNWYGKVGNIEEEPIPENTDKNENKLPDGDVTNEKTIQLLVTEVELLEQRLLSIENNYTSDTSYFVRQWKQDKERIMALLRELRKDHEKINDGKSLDR